MCVIIHLPKGKTLSEELLKACYDTNHDGWGILVAEGGKLHYAKNITPFSDFLTYWKDTNPEVDRAIHFRIRTQGTISEGNCHPFFPNTKVGVMHNGMIDTIIADINMSDTHNFVKYEMRPTLKGWETAQQDFMDDPTFIKLMEKLTGSSKLLFMTDDGRVMLTRKNVWVERDGCSFSNNNSFWRADTRTQTYAGGSFYDTHYKSYGHKSSSTVQTNKNVKTEAEKASQKVKETTEALKKQVESMAPDDELYEAWNAELNAMTPPDKKVTVLSSKQAPTILDNSTQHGLSWLSNTFQRKPNHYEVMSNLTSETVVSDLYSGNKTDAEGLAMEQQSEEDWDEYDVVTNPQATPDYYTRFERDFYDGETIDQVAEEVTEEEEDIMPEEWPLTFNQALVLATEGNLYDWVSDYPNSAQVLIEELLEEMISNNLIDFTSPAESTQHGEEASTDKKVATSK